jgi:hypothetical protein
LLLTGHGFRGVASTLLHEQGWPQEHIAGMMMPKPIMSISSVTRTKPMPGVDFLCMENSTIPSTPESSAERGDRSVDGRLTGSLHVSHYACDTY